MNGNLSAVIALTPSFTITVGVALALYAILRVSEPTRRRDWLLVIGGIWVGAGLTALFGFATVVVGWLL